MVAAVVVPVGFALSLQSDSQPARSREDVSTAAASSVALTVPALLVTTDAPSGSFLDDVPDSAKLFLMGTFLVSVATAMRRAG
jgi:hypothetical protein